MDRHGKDLAINRQSISAFIFPHKLRDRATVESFLAQHFPHASAQLQDHTKQFIYVQRALSPEQLDIINKACIKDIYLLQESSRFYPVPCTGLVVGKTDVDNNGILGIEYKYNNTLMGTPSIASLHKDARSGHYYFKKETKQVGNSGTPLYLTIDSNLQFLVTEELQKAVARVGANYGCALIMDPQTGEILTMTTWPHANPNISSIRSLEDTKNRVISDAFELGSVIKVFCALAALEQSTVTPEELIDCRNTKTACIDGRTINTPKAHGAIPFTDVIAHSNNIGIAIVAKRIGDQLYNHYTRFGFGTKTGINLPGEHKGFVNHPSRWSKQSIISLSYGYEITTTLLQISCAFCMIARNGYPVRPTITRPFSPIITATHSSDTDVCPCCSPESIMAIKRILERTTQAGTAQHARIKGYTIMSKTGTANQLTNGIYDHNKHLYTCAGIIEKNGYQRVIVTFLNNSHYPNAYASTIVAPLFERITQKMLIHERIL